MAERWLREITDKRIRRGSFAGVSARVGPPGDLRGRSPEAILRALLAVLR